MVLEISSKENGDFTTLLKFKDTTTNNTRQFKVIGIINRIAQSLDGQHFVLKQENQGSIVVNNPFFQNN